MGLMVTHILRGAQLLLAIIVLGLAADGAHQFYGGYAPSQTAFMIFNAVWTMLVVAYFMLAPRFFEPAAHPFVKVAVDALTMLFWFAGFIAIAVLASAAGAVDYDFSLDVDYDYDSFHKFYQVTAATAAMGAFEWILFVATLVLSVLETFKGNASQRNHVAANPEVQV